MQVLLDATSQGGCYCGYPSGHSGGRCVCRGVSVVTSDKGGLTTRGGRTVEFQSKRPFTWPWNLQCQHIIILLWSRLKFHSPARDVVVPPLDQAYAVIDNGRGFRQTFFAIPRT